VDAGKSAVQAQGAPEQDASPCRARRPLARLLGSEARLALMEPYKLDADRFEARSFAAALGLTARLGLLALLIQLETLNSQRVWLHLLTAGLEA
jgi:hypothetical protein